MTGRLKHAERSHKTHHKNDVNSNYFYNSNAMQANIKKTKKEHASLFEKVMGLLKKGDK